MSKATATTGCEGRNTDRLADILTNHSMLVTGLREHRNRRGWTQAELSRRSGVPRSTIAAIESGAMTPSVETALALARALDSTVERLFERRTDNPLRWAWQPLRPEPAYWEAAFADDVLSYPVEPLASGLTPPDGWWDGQSGNRILPDGSAATLVIASCDPAASVLAALLAAEFGVRVLSFQRSSRESLALLKQGLVHVAGTHLEEIGERTGNPEVVRESLGAGYHLLRGAVWHEGIAVRSRSDLTEPLSAVLSRLRWIGRTPGSGARRCQDKVLVGDLAPDRTARNHWEVAIAVRSGWADAGICHRLAAEQSGLGFLQVSREVFDFCYPAGLEHDPRLKALKQVVRSARYRQCLERLTGIETETTGLEVSV